VISAKPAIIGNVFTRKPMEFDLKTLKQLYKAFEANDLDKKCAYCGARATDRDHVVPRTYFHDDGRPHFRFHMHINNIVWACRECNSVASDTLQVNFWEKKKYICERIKTRYSKFLKRPRWKESEIRELRGKIRTHVFANERFKDQLLLRIENLEKPEICGNVEASREP